MAAKMAELEEKQVELDRLKYRAKLEVGRGVGVAVCLV